MFLFPPTIILRHRKENLRKCSLRGLEDREDIHFFTYPKDTLPDLTKYFLLTMDAPELSRNDEGQGLFLIDGTWKYAETMFRQLKTPYQFCRRSLPANYQTAYPRRQEDCSDPARGLASIEALYIAYRILGRSGDKLLDHYHWKEDFFKKNEGALEQLV
jgi:pre-rRNA-processing protein TSR3